MGNAIHLKTNGKPKKDGRGRPPIFSQRQSIAIKNLIARNIRIKDIAEIFECNETTIYEHANKNKYFSNSYKEGKQKLIESLESALYKKAKGFTNKKQVVTMKDGVAQTHEVEDYYPPDTGALVFALTNLSEQRWKNKRYTDNRISGTITVDDKRKKEISERFSRYGHLIDAGTPSIQ